MQLDTGARSDHVALLLERFPADDGEARSGTWGEWTRGFEERFIPLNVRPKAWLHVETGNIGLVESVRSEEREGRIAARLWVQASGSLVNLLPAGPRYYSESHSNDLVGRADTMSRVLDELRHLDGLDLPI